MLKSRTYIATPPGRTIEEIISNENISSNELAKRMDLSSSQLNELLDGTMPLTGSIAEDLERVLGVPATFWLNLESNYRTKLELVRKEIESDNAAYKEIMVAKAVEAKEKGVLDSEDVNVVSRFCDYLTSTGFNIPSLV